MAVFYFVCLCLPDSLSNYVTSVDLFRSWKTGAAGKESNTQPIKLANQQIGRNTDHATAILFVRNDAQTDRFSIGFAVIKRCIVVIDRCANVENMNPIQITAVGL